MTMRTRNTRTSREQDAREFNPIHGDDGFSWEDTGPLPEIPARPGFSQRWIQLTPKRLMRASQMGYVPRPPDTVAKAFQVLTVQREGLGGVIGTHDMVLMEVPEEMAIRRREAVRRRTRELEKAVSNSLFREHERLRREGDGFVPHRMQAQAEIERGRLPVVPDDPD